MKTKNSKRVLALILSFFMILTVLPFNVMASGEPGGEPATPKTTAELKQEALAKISEVETNLRPELEKVKDAEVKKQQTEALTNVVNGTKAKIAEVKDEEEAPQAKTKIEPAMTEFDNITNRIAQNVQAQLEKEKKAEEAAAKQLSVTTNVYYDAITGTVVDGTGKAVVGATVSVGTRTTTTDARGNFSLDMTKESGNYYCGYYGNKGYTWNNYPYNSYKVDTTTGYSYNGINNSSYGRYFFLVDGNGNIVDSTYANAYANYSLRGAAYTTYTVYSSEYGYNYGYPYYDKYYNRYYNPSTTWSNGKTLTASKDGYTPKSIPLGNVDTYSWLYTTCYEYGYPYGYDRVIYPSALSLSGNGTIVSGKVGVSYLPIYVYRNGVFLGSGNADVNGYFSIGLNSRVSSTSDLTFYAYGKTEATPQKKADHGVIPVKSTVVIGSTKLIKNINGVEADVNMDVAPFIRDGRTMLPLRYIAEALGFKVDWDRATRTVTLTDKEFKVQIPVETNKIIVNGSTYYSDANPVIRNNRTMLPVANIARALGLKDGTDILWDANTRVATITRLVKY